MRVYFLNELFRLTRNELFELHARILLELNALPFDHPEREIAFDNLRSIRQVLAHQAPHYS